MTVNYSPFHMHFLKFLLEYCMEKWETFTEYMLAVSMSYVPFICKFPMIMLFVLFLYKCFGSKIYFYVFSYHQTILRDFKNAYTKIFDF